MKSILEPVQPSACRMKRSLGASRNDSETIFSGGSVSIDTSTTEKYFMSVSDVPEDVYFLRELGNYVSSSLDGRFAEELIRGYKTHV